MAEKKKYSLGLIAFLQALILVVYCSLVAFVMWNSNRWFGKVPNYFVPLLILILFTTSALISGIITLYYPFILVWKKKQTDQALRLVLYTAGWLVLFSLLVALRLFFSR